MLMLKLNLLSLISLFLSFKSYSQIEPHIIYGEDDRADLPIFSNNKKILAIASSTALILDRNELTETISSRHLELITNVLGKKMDFCEEERYYEQPTAGFCSGFLISPKRLLTAGHCLSKKEDCESLAFLFDYNTAKIDLSQVNKKRARVSLKNVFTCNKVLFFGKEDHPKKLDLAIIELDRPATSRKSLKLNERNDVSSVKDFFTAGYPLGMPLKIAGPASLKDEDSETFTVNLDAYAGNSGSPVFNLATGAVEGILLSGGTDFVTKGNCQISARCDGPLCPGEVILKSTPILKVYEAL